MKTIIAALLITVSTLTFADRQHDNNRPVQAPPAEPPVNIIQVAPGRQCDEYQIRVITTRGNNSIDAETLGYCDLELAQNVLAQLNASAYRKLPKGQAIQQIAYPLF